jgi:hypothetical protein
VDRYYLSDSRRSFRVMDPFAFLAAATDGTARRIIMRPEHYVTDGGTGYQGMVRRYLLATCDEIDETFGVNSTHAAVRRRGRSTSVRAQAHHPYLAREGCMPVSSCVVGEILADLGITPNRVSSNTNARFDHLATVCSAAAGAIAFCLAGRVENSEQVLTDSAAVILTNAEQEDGFTVPSPRAAVVLDDPRLVYVGVLNHCFRPEPPPAGVHPTAAADASAMLADSCSIGPSEPARRQIGELGVDRASIGDGSLLTVGMVVAAAAAATTAMIDLPDPLPRGARLPRIALFGTAFGAMLVIDILQAAGSGTAVAVADRSPAVADHCRALDERQSWSSRADTFASVIGPSWSSQDCPDPLLAGRQP